MEFIRDCEYYRTKIARFKGAMEDTRKRLKRLEAAGVPQVQIDAYKEQLEAQRNQLFKAQEDYGALLGELIDAEEEKED